MKKILTATAVAAALAAGNVDAAGNDSKTFNVNITLTAACKLGAVTDLAFTYTAMQAAVANATGGGFNVTCTKNLPFTFGLVQGTTGATAPGAATITVTDSVVALDYTLGLSAAGSNGTGAAQSFSVTGTMAGSQAGQCASFPPASCDNTGATNKTHTLFVNY